MPECQKICQVECQIECQIECIRMPEDTSDRMPEDLPVTKRINVMVRITRSKVICFGSIIMEMKMDWHSLICILADIKTTLQGSQSEEQLPYSAFCTLTVANQKLQRGQSTIFPHSF